MLSQLLLSASSSQQQEQKAKLTASIRDDSTLWLDIQMPSLFDAPLTHVCFVLDVSGSMDAGLETKGMESNGLTRLDIAKHAIVTVMECMPEGSHVSVILFASSAVVLFRDAVMLQATKKTYVDQVKAVRSAGATHLWAGLALGFEVAEASSVKNQHMMVLTDGDRPIVPEGGFLPQMFAVKHRNEGVYPCTVHLFGFCYQLDSELLLLLAQEGGGMYAFIPDGSMVGTVFINAYANAVAMVTPELSLTIGDDVQQGSMPALLHTIGCDQVKGTSSQYTLSIPATVESSDRCIGLVFDQSQGNEDQGNDDTKTTFVVRLSYRDFDGVQHVVETSVSNEAKAKGKEKEAKEEPKEKDKYTTLYHEVALARSTLVDGIKKLLFNAGDAASILQTVHALLSAYSEKTQHDFRVTAFLGDLDGQIKEAVANERAFVRWGRHYLRSLQRAHELQQCNNFKDPGVQPYGDVSPLFTRMRDQAEATFASLPAPVPSNVSSKQQTTGRVNMQAYIDRSGGCIDPRCLVVLQDGSTMPLADLETGSVLYGGGVVDTIVWSECSGSIVTLSKAMLQQQEEKKDNWLRLTAYHPVSLQPGVWQFPSCLLGAVQKQEKEWMVSVLLQEGNAQHMLMGGYWVATLAHGNTTDPVLAHSFLGTDAVREALREGEGKERKGRKGKKGHVHVSYTRSSQTGLVDGLFFC